MEAHGFFVVTEMKVAAGAVAALSAITLSAFLDTSVDYTYRRYLLEAYLVLAEKWQGQPVH